MNTIAKTDLTVILEQQIWKHTIKPMGTFGCFEVTIGWYGRERIDFITYDSKDIWRCYEIKVSKADFRSKAKVSFVGHYNYYVMPIELFQEVKDEIPANIGVFAYNGKHLQCIKRPIKQELGVDEHILKNSLIRSLYREAERSISSKDEAIVGKLRKELARAESNAHRNYKQVMDLHRRLYEKYGDSWKDNL